MDNNVIGVYSDGLGLGLLAYGCVYDYVDERLIIANETNGVVGKKRKCKIRYNAQGQPYIISYGRRRYLDEFLRVNL